MSVGGSILDITVGDRIFPVTADADVERKLGGFEVEQEMNGDGTARPIMTRVGWSLSGIVISMDENRADQQFLQDCADGVNADSDGYYAITITYVNGTTYMGKGRPMGEIKSNSKNSTCTVSFTGPGKLEKQ